MSNHQGSYLLNEVLEVLERRQVFEVLGTSATQDLVKEIVRLSRRYDCNDGEILEGIGERVGICMICVSSQPDLVDGLCGPCREKYFGYTSDAADE